MSGRDHAQLVAIALVYRDVLRSLVVPTNLRSRDYDFHTKRAMRKGLDGTCELG